jgi:hypothetical protein
MSRQHSVTKRARTEHQDGAAGADKLPGREQLLLTSPELQSRVGLRFVDEAELLPLLLAHGLIRRVRTIQIEVRPLGGDSFKVRLDASKPTVKEAKAEITRSQGTTESRQELYKIAERADGLAVREDDAEPEPLEHESTELEEGDVVAMAVISYEVRVYTAHTRCVCTLLMHCSYQVTLNAAGNPVARGRDASCRAKMYCGKRCNTSSMSDGMCGPSNGPPCSDCNRMSAPSQNRAGAVVSFGADSSCKCMLYCGRYLGRNAIPGSDGHCGPSNGPRCGDCTALPGQ